MGRTALNGKIVREKFDHLTDEIMKRDFELVNPDQTCSIYLRTQDRITEPSVSCERQFILIVCFQNSEVQLKLEHNCGDFLCC